METFEQQRSRSNLDRDELTYFIFGSKERYEHAKSIMYDPYIKGGFVRDPRIYEMSRYDVIEYNIKR